MKIKRAELFQMYWGASGLPSEWRTEHEIGLALGVSNEKVIGLLRKNDIPPRTPSQRSHMIMWRSLCLIGLKANTDFYYRIRVNLKMVDFSVMRSDNCMVCFNFVEGRLLPELSNLVVGKDKKPMAQLWTIGATETEFAIGKVKQFLEGV